MLWSIFKFYAQPIPTKAKGGPLCGGLSLNFVCFYTVLHTNLGSWSVIYYIPKGGGPLCGGLSLNFIICASIQYCIQTSGVGQ